MGCSSCAKRKKTFLNSVQQKELLDKAVKFGNDIPDEDLNKLQGKDFAFKKIQIELSSRAKRIKEREARINKRNQRIKDRNDAIISPQNKKNDVAEIMHNLRKYKNLKSPNKKRDIY